MSRRKRSGRLIPLLSVLALVTGCGAAGLDSAGAVEEPGSVALLASGFDPVATLTTSEEWAQGVHAHPLRAGESLAFVFPQPRSPVWTMAGVGYPLRLVALDSAGAVAGRMVMPACPRPASSVDCQHSLGIPGTVFLEVRPKSR